MRILVTGGAGFIGSHLCRMLVGRGHDVVVFDNMSTGSLASLLPVDADVVIGDVRDVPALTEASGDADAIVHLAAVASVAASVECPAGVHDVNVTGTVNVLDVARRRGAHVVFASSAAVYGAPSTTPVHEDDPIEPVNPYGASKAAAELYARAYTASYGTQTMRTRLFNVYGPGQRRDCGAVVPALIASSRAGLPLPIHGDGSQRRDFVYVGDVACVLAEVVERRLAGVANVGSGTGTTVGHLASRLATLAGKPLATTGEPPRPCDVRDSVADIDQLRELLDFTPTPLSVGLEATWLATESCEVLAGG